MTDDQVRELFAAGQLLLRTLYSQWDRRPAVRLEATLLRLYNDLGLPVATCSGCGADTPEKIMNNDLCPSCHE